MDVCIYVYMFMYVYVYIYIYILTYITPHTYKCIGIGITTLHKRICMYEYGQQGIAQECVSSASPGLLPSLRFGGNERLGLGV